MSDSRRRAGAETVRWHRLPERAQAAVLVLHGGRSEGLAAVGPWDLARLRMRPFVRSLLHELRGERVAVGEVRYRVRGWNGDRADAAVDAKAAVEQVRIDCGPVPVVLVGHSMGGRAALRAAVAPQVAGVVALAPWCVPGDPYEQFAGKRLATLHDVGDRVTDPTETRAFAAAARRSGAQVCGFLVHGSGHPMLGRARDWHAVTTRLVGGLLELRKFPDEVSVAMARHGDDQGGLDLPLPRRSELRDGS